MYLLYQARLVFCRNVNGRCAADLSFVDDSDQKARWDGSVGLYNNRHIIFLIESFHDGSNTWSADLAASVDDFACVSNSYENTVFLEVYGGRGLWFGHIDTGFFNKDRGHDEEDQKNEDDVNEWRDVNLFVAFSGLFSTFSECHNK